MKVAYQASREQKKAVRAKKVDSIIIELTRQDGTKLSFDGNEVSQQRLDLFSRRAQVNGYQAIPWVMADNTVAQVTPEEMIMALDLALQKQGELWFI